MHAAAWCCAHTTPLIDHWQVCQASRRLERRLGAVHAARTRATRRDTPVAGTRVTQPEMSSFRQTSCAFAGKVGTKHNDSLL